MRSEAIRSVIRAYDDPIVRAYCWGRFWILRQRFLDEIGQYLPARGRVLDLGCGFGLFSLYYASVHPELTVEGFDRNARRIGMGRAAARQGRGSAAGLQALVHPRAGPDHGSGHPGALLGHRGAAGAPRERRLRRAPPPDGRRAALSPRPLHRPAPPVSAETSPVLLRAEGLTAGYGKLAI